jgi:D-alanine-D-alanine ligase
MAGHTILVLSGGPDREREVSIHGAACVAAALREAGHEVIERDIMPDDLSALDVPCDAVFPVLHGPFGEGGPLQKLVEQRKLRFVGCSSRAARTAIDKYLTKQVADKVGIVTPPYQQLGPAGELTIDLPVVLKPLNDGSSFNVAICHTADDVAAARTQLHQHHAILLAERFVAGREMTVGILDGKPLPTIEIVPEAAFYDYQAKYLSDVTRYEFDFDAPAHAIDAMQRDAVRLFEALGARHLARVDFMLDPAGKPWMLEINTMPGFTDHSLLPKAAGRTGLSMAQLCDRLVKLALDEPVSR